MCCVNVDQLNYSLLSAFKSKIMFFTTKLKINFIFRLDYSNYRYYFNFLIMKNNRFIHGFNGI